MYDKLKEIIYHKAQLDHYNSSENSFYIKETDRSAICKKVTLLKFESENTTFGFELDCKNVRCRGIHKISPYFENGKDLDKGNDAIIFTTINSQHYVFICDLKDGARGYTKQFQSSSCFVDYLRSILKRVHGFNLDNIIFKYLIFSTKGSATTVTNGKYPSKNVHGFDTYNINCKKGKYYIESFI